MLLPRLLESVDLGADLAVGIVDERGRWRGAATEWPADEPAIETRSRADGAPLAGTLAEAGLEGTLPGWKVVLVDGKGRSITQIVTRENRAYGMLMVGLVVVLAAGVAFTARAASHEVELSRLRSEFVANVTHELKTPLALIRMYGETLESGLVANEVERQEFFAIIRRESERLTHLINNVLDLARSSRGPKSTPWPVRISSLSCASPWRRTGATLRLQRHVVVYDYGYGTRGSEARRPGSGNDS